MHAPSHLPCMWLLIFKQVILIQFGWSPPSPLHPTPSPATNFRKFKPKGSCQVSFFSFSFNPHHAPCVLWQNSFLIGFLTPNKGLGHICNNYKSNCNCYCFKTSRRVEHSSHFLILGKTGGMRQNKSSKLVRRNCRLSGRKTFLETWRGVGVDSVCLCRCSPVEGSGAAGLWSPSPDTPSETHAMCAWFGGRRWVSTVGVACQGLGNPKKT